MRKVLVIAGNSLLRTSRDRKGLMMLLVMPLLLIGILGVTLGAMMGPSKINPFDVLVINADRPAKPAMPPGTPAAVLDQVPAVDFGRMLAQDVMGSEQVSRLIKGRAADDLEQAKADVSAGKAVAVIYVPDSFSTEILAGKKAAVKVYTDPGRPTQASIVTQVVQSFTDQLTGGITASKSMSQAELAELSRNPQSVMSRLEAVMPKLTEVPTGAKAVSALQYYAAAMSIMYMVMTAFSRSKAILEERQDGTLDRMLTAPTGRGTIIAGQIVSSVVIMLAQFAILVTGTSLIFRVDWGPTLPVLAIGGSLAIAASGIGMAAAGILRDPKAADTAVGLVGNLFAMLSGGMFPLYMFPDSLKLVARFIPNYWALQGFLDQMAGVGAGRLWMPVAVLTAIGLATGALGSWRLAGR